MVSKTGGMMHLLDGKRFLVTGVANRWSIAWSVAEAIVREGGMVAFTYQGETQLANLQKQIGELPTNESPRLIPLDVRDDSSVDEAVRQAESGGKRYDGLVHSIAFAKREELDGAFLDTSREGFLLAQEVSAYSLVLLCRAFSGILNDGASVVAMTYLGAERVVPHYNVMGAAKAALEASVRYLAFDLGQRSIRVNALSAGPVKTASGRAIKGFTDMQKAVSEQAPLRKPLTTEEVGDVTVCLLSDLFRAVTGELIHVDMGYHALGMVLPLEQP
ncbi:MAG: enoyl-ACP reductase [Nitrospirae bacterium]|nr:enoyl-ACP reductase [Nitrospirota bacterium]